MTREGDKEVLSNTVHVFAENWALQADGYDPVTFKHGMISYAGSAVTSFFTKIFK